MDKTSTVIAALNAGKLPSSEQLAGWVNAALNSAVLSNEPSADGGELSQQGKSLQSDIRDLLTAWNELGESKNGESNGAASISCSQAVLGDNLLQESLWHLSAADLSSTTTDVDIDTDEAKRDAQKLAHALRTLVSVVGENLSQEGRSVFHDFASFSRLALADAAEYVATGAHKTAEGLRELDSQVDAGERNEIGLKKRKQDEAEDDVRAKFEKTMDTTKVVGSKAIGAGQVAVGAAEDVANRTTTRLQDAFNKVCICGSYWPICTLTAYRFATALKMMSSTTPRSIRFSISCTSGSTAASIPLAMSTRIPHLRHSSTTQRLTNTSSRAFVACALSSNVSQAVRASTTSSMHSASAV